MAEPGSATRSAVITATSKGYRPQALVAERIFPILPVETTEAKLYFVDEKMRQLRIKDFTRAPGAPSHPVDWDYSSETVTIPDHSPRKSVPIEEGNPNAEPILLRQESVAQTLTRMILLQRERELSDYLFNASTFSGHTDTTALKLDQSSGAADVCDTIDAGKDTIAGEILEQGNCLAVGRAVHRAICKQLRAQLAASSVGSLAVTREMIRNLLELDDYIVGAAAFNSAGEDEDKSMTKLWPEEYMLLFYRPPSPAPQQMALGYHVVPKSIGINGILGETNNLLHGAAAIEVVVHHYYKRHLFCAAAGLLYTNCLGAS
jgi:hypothetical protein